MLQTLHIKNFALIERLHIDFSDKLSIITGETGAGKSILLGALGHVLGNRADLTSLKDKEQKCVIEAHFAIADYNLQEFFENSGMDYDDVTIIRREILPSGKSRAFVNDSPVNLQELQQLGNFLIDIHSQQQTRELSDEQYQLYILDTLGGNATELAAYKNQLPQYKKLQQELAQAREQLAGLAREQDYNNFLLQELLDASLKAGEQEEIEQELEMLSNVEFIKESVSRALAVAGEEQVGVLQNLKEVRNTLQKISGISAEYAQFYERINSVLIEFDDIVQGLSESAETLSDDPQRLELISQKLQLIYSLQKKHNVATVAELLDIQNELDNKALQTDGLASTIEKLDGDVKASAENLDDIAARISGNREKAVPVFTEKVTAILAQLGMADARFKFYITQTTSYYSNGKDTVSLMLSANKGTDFGLMKKVASGGEMSRIMLAVKAVLAEYSKLPSIIFDEIDTGVSGEISNKMGDIMKAMSRSMQVFAITHLPQIAAKGNQHYKVYKSVQGSTTISELKQLSPEERVVEIAEMLSGKDISSSALNHARALLN